MQKNLIKKDYKYRNEVRNKFRTQIHEEMLEDIIEYLKEAGYEGEPAVYYYSCLCGEKGTDTFEAGYPSGLVYYTVTWKNYDGTILKTDTENKYGETPT